MFSRGKGVFAAIVAVLLVSILSLGVKGVGFSLHPFDQRWIQELNDLLTQNPDAETRRSLQEKLAMAEREASERAQAMELCPVLCVTKRGSPRG